MEWISVESSNIAAVAYDADLSVLVVRFKNGIEWAYQSVSAELYFEFLDSESKGKFFNDKIRLQYLGRKIEPMKKEEADEHGASES